MRFGEINREIGDISKQMLSRTLKRLEQDGFVKRTLFAEIPPRVAFESPYRQFRTRARARRVVPISELVFGTLTQNRSSLEPSLGFAAITGPSHVVDRARCVQAPEEPKRDPKGCGASRRTSMLCRSRLPPAKSTTKVPPFSMGYPQRGFRGIGRRLRRLRLS